MLFRIALLVIVYLAFSRTATLYITVYNNARFDSNDIRYMSSDLSSVSSANACLCQCYNQAICLIATYFGINHTCLLFFAQLNQGQLRVVPTIFNATVYYFGNRSVGGLQFFKPTNTTLYPLWNTTAGGNSTTAVSGYSTGMYYPTDIPKAAFDGDLTTDYTSYGTCNISYATQTSTCGEKTGVYFTLNTGPIILVAFYMGTSGWQLNRDPTRITIEGSNLNGSALVYGSSWTLIYNDTSGLMSITSHSTLGTLEILPSFSTPFASYRLLITSVRGIETCASYSEFRLIGY